MRHVAAAIGSVALLLAANPALATVRNFTASLTGGQESPPVATPATGQATITIDDVSGLVTVNGTFTGLTAPSSNCHLHGLSPLGGPSAPVLIPIPFSSGVTSGTFSGSGTLSGANLTGALNGQTYVNVHSVGPFSGGEIRGQVLEVVAAPALPSWGLALLTLSLAGAGAWLVARRRVISVEG